MHMCVRVCVRVYKFRPTEHESETNHSNASHPASLPLTQKLPPVYPRKTAIARGFATPRRLGQRASFRKDIKGVYPLLD